MTPDTPKPSPNATETPAKWVSVSEAAAALRVSIRTVKRWIETGEVESRKEGGRRLVLMLDSGADESAKRDTEGTRQKGHNPGGVSPSVSLHAQKEGQKGHLEDDKGDTARVPLVPSVSPSVTDSSAGAAPDFGARYLEHLEKENEFLRRALESSQQSEAVTKAALREALKAMPKQLTSGERSGAASGELSEVVRQKTRDVVTPGAASNEMQDGEVSSYSALADWLENEMNL